MQLHWVGTWAAAPQLVEEHNMPPSPGLAHNTLRQIVRTSIDGKRVRLKFSNQYGGTSLMIKAASLALAETGSAVYAGTEKQLTFDGDQSITIAPGGTCESDPIDFPLPALTTVAITIYFGDVPENLTGHPGSRTNSYLLQGNAVGAERMPDAVPVEHWYVISGIDILTEDLNTAAVVTLGDSLTDGRGSTTDKNNRWPDILANRLQADQRTAKVAVLNQGIGGNAVLSGGLGPNLLSRFERDGLNQPGVRYIIVLAGVNDIGAVHSEDNTAEKLIKAYELMIDQAHQRNLLIYGGTIMPFGESWYYTPVREKIRQEVNHWIRTSNRFDAVIDFAAAVQDPDNLQRILKLYDSGDMLHLNPKGYQRMGEAVDLDLFTK